MPVHLTITVRARFAGLHCWPDAPEPVAFLRALHRHEFHVALTCEVTNADRQLEFFTLKKELEYVLDKELTPRLKNDAKQSCETMAGWLLARFQNRRAIKVVVSEGGENDGTAEHRL